MNQKMMLSAFHSFIQFRTSLDVAIHIVGNGEVEGKGGVLHLHLLILVENEITH